MGTRKWTPILYSSGNEDKKVDTNIASYYSSGNWDKKVDTNIASYYSSGNVDKKVDTNIASYHTNVNSSKEPISSKAKKEEGNIMDVFKDSSFKFGDGCTVMISVKNFYKE